MHTRDTVIYVTSNRNQNEVFDSGKGSLLGQGLVKSFNSRTGNLSSTSRRLYDRNTGWPKCREAYGYGAMVVVGGVTTTHGDWESQSQGEAWQVNQLQ